jgi:uncharacterized protein (DUF3084 family)
MCITTQISDWLSGQVSSAENIDPQLRQLKDEVNKASEQANLAAATSANNMVPDDLRKALNEAIWRLIDYVSVKRIR